MLKTESDRQGAISAGTYLADPRAPLPLAVVRAAADGIVSDTSGAGSHHLRRIQ